MRPQLGELPLVDIGVFDIELVRDDDAKGGIAEEFEAFVRADADAGVFVEVGGMDQRLPEQVGVLELDSQPSFELMAIRHVYTSRPAREQPDSTAAAR